MKELEHPQVTVTAAEDLRLGRQRVPVVAAALTWQEWVAAIRRQAVPSWQYSPSNVIHIGLQANVLCVALCALLEQGQAQQGAYARWHAATYYPSNALRSLGADSATQVPDASALLFVRCGQIAICIPDVIRRLGGGFPGPNEDRLDEAGWDAQVMQNSRAAQDHSGSVTLLLQLQKDAGAVAATASERNLDRLVPALVDLARSGYHAFRFYERFCKGEEHGQ